MKILVTGSAGFIGFYVCQYLLKQGDEVLGLDNINDYYDIKLKYKRLLRAGIKKEKIQYAKFVKSDNNKNYRFIQLDLEDQYALQELFVNEKFDSVCHLAAQVGVRNSTKNPMKYVSSNIVGFLNILELCKRNKIQHLVYASSSSVYGLNEQFPSSENSSIAHPLSIYAASKKSNELMAHAYSHLFNIPTTGLRLFTVYGPWGRPDMAPMLFTDAIMNDRPIKVYNNGDMYRDFTYIDDVAEAIIKALNNIPKPNANWDAQYPDPQSSTCAYRIYNVGNSQPISLLDFISELENALGKEAKKVFLPMQVGDVYQTNADISSIQKDIGYIPKTNIVDGIRKTVEWYKAFYKKS